MESDRITELMTQPLNYAVLRALHALEHDVSREDINLQLRIDQMGNPHNEPYPNKRPRREEAQIVSDLKYQHADKVLMHQHGYEYKEWLKRNGFEQDRWTETWRKA